MPRQLDGFFRKFLVPSTQLERFSRKFLVPSTQLEHFSRKFVHSSAHHLLQQTISAHKCLFKPFLCVYKMLILRIKGTSLAYPVINMLSLTRH
ncbi:MAG: hypothetical protein JNL70_18500 [Saprospiraceae bacterium]|nr:hypothetical protein [Saprospiraceae bacterium]